MNEPKTNDSAARNAAPALIYVVDDEPMLLELATVILEPLGYEVKSFRDPQAALDSFRSARPQPALIVTDYSMHNMTGMDLLEGCRRARPGQKILLVSGTVDERVYRDSAWKPDQFLAKPYHARQLVEAVKELLGD
jgi:CheY-like chemotaxis protein